MRILLDENIPVDLALELLDHQVDTVIGLGWAGTKNGELLGRASGRYDAFIAMDRNIEYQQNVSAFSLVLVLHAPSNRLIHLQPLVRAILDALTALAPGHLRHVGAYQGV